jgi:acetyltransferase-like isoleucine patch superfamily enzyme
MSPTKFQAKIIDTIFGHGCIVVEPSNIYSARISDNVFIGPFVEIQRNVVIGSNTKVQSHSFLCELVTVGEDCFIGHGVMFVNDLFRSGRPAKGDKSKWAPTSIGDRVSIGNNSTILPVTICDDVVIGAGSVVVKNITSSGVYAGNPAKRVK